MKKKIIAVLFAITLVLGTCMATAVPALASRPPPASIVYVDASYSDGSAGGHSFGYDAFATIQGGINGVDGGGTVNVAAGTYYELITLKDGVKILGAGAGTTTVDGSSTGTVVTAVDVGSATRLNGFTITHGLSAQGGGMFNSNSSPEVTNCNFSVNGNTATSGGGMFNYNSSPVVTNCTFFSNSAWDGAGMLNEYGSSPQVTGCTFSSNSASDNGGGMFNYQSSSPQVTNCIFSGNYALQGGGMINMYNSSPILTNCTFSGNSDTYGAGGMLNQQTSLPTVTNCILWGDSGHEILDESGSVPVVAYCDIQGGYSGTSNINADPLFVSAKGNYHLKPGSPCINAGSNAAVPSWLTTDIAGSPRIFGGVVDMGAYEVTPTDATLSRIIINNGTLNPSFASTTTDYTADVANSIRSIAIRPMVHESHATITVNGTPLVSNTYSGSINLNVGANPITVVVTAGDGITTKTYTIVVTRAPSTDATLSRISINHGTLNPSFASTTTDYTANVANSIRSIAVRPMVHESHATITVNKTPLVSNTYSGSINLNVGANTITVVATAEDGITTKTYTIVVTRAPSTDATLSRISINHGTLNPSFASTTTDYTTDVANSIRSIAVRPMVHESHATITVNKTPLVSNTYSGSINLNVGANTITVVATAEDGITTKTYTIVVTRAP